jgi:chemotaxis protein MotB
VQSVLRARLDSVASIGRLKARVEVTVSKGGLRIELIEDENGDTFFPFGSAAIKEQGRLALGVIGEELTKLDNPVVIEGHTDAAQYQRRDYTNWELSADRANAARRILEGTGLAATRVVEVNGLADKQLRVPHRPLDPANRRISILLPFLEAPETPSVDALKQRLEGAAGNES